MVPQSSSGNMRLTSGILGATPVPTAFHQVRFTMFFRRLRMGGVAVGAYYSVGPSRLGDKVFQKLNLKPGQAHDVGDVRVNTRPE